MDSIEARLVSLEQNKADIENVHNQAWSEVKRLSDRLALLERMCQNFNIILGDFKTRIESLEKLGKSKGNIQ
jgi:hypothetical protein